MMEDDLSRVVEIENRVHAAPSGSPWTRDHFASELGKNFSTCWVLTDDETDQIIAGYIVFWTLETAHLLNVVVDVPFRRKGFARKLVRLAVREAMRKNLKRMVLEVRKTNRPAIELYQSLRFGIHHIRKGAYSNGEDAYEMELFLDPDAAGSAEIIEF